MRNYLFKKSLIIGIIIMFFGVAIIPGTYAYINNSNIIKQKTIHLKNNIDELYKGLSSSEDVVEILITNYKPDGSIEKTIIILPRERAEELNEELKETRKPEEKLTIYKEYDLIPQNVKPEKLRIGMLQKSQNLGLTQKKIEKLSKLYFPFKNVLSSYTAFNINCNISGKIKDGLKYLIGLSAFTSLINLLFIFWSLTYRLPSVDLVNIYVGEYGNIDAINGMMDDIHTGYGFIIAIVAGFVGYNIVFPPIPGILEWSEFLGYAVFVAAIY